MVTEICSIRHYYNIWTGQVTGIPNSVRLYLPSRHNITYIHLIHLKSRFQGFPPSLCWPNYIKSTQCYFESGRSYPAFDMLRFTSFWYLNNILSFRTIEISTLLQIGWAKTKKVSREKWRQRTKCKSGRMVLNAMFKTKNWVEYFRELETGELGDPSSEDYPTGNNLHFLNCQSSLAERFLRNESNS